MCGDLSINGVFQINTRRAFLGFTCALSGTALLILLACWSVTCPKAATQTP
ncbi:MAG: twin-arginine translocation signal domain-containing protein, partial [Planctomycetota bacterium]